MQLLNICEKCSQYPAQVFPGTGTIKSKYTDFVADIFLLVYYFLNVKYSVKMKTYLTTAPYSNILTWLTCGLILERFHCLCRYPACEMTKTKKKNVMKSST